VPAQALETVRDAGSRLWAQGMGTAV